MRSHLLWIAFKTLAGITAMTFFIFKSSVVMADGPEQKAIPMDQSSVGPNEKEFKIILSGLKDTLQKIKAAPEVASHPGLGPQVVEANRSLERAKSNFDAKDWLSVTQELNSYLSLTQHPDTTNWLKAQFMLGRAYEELGQLQRASRAYTRYLATFTTMPTKDLADLTETFERLIRIATKDKKASRDELNKFLSSLTAMEFPANASAEMQYLTAVAGSNIGQSNLAASWLGHLDQGTTTPETRARAKFFRALMAIHGKDWDTARDELETILQLDQISSKTRDTTLLSLARVYSKQKKPELSVATYSKIAEHSDDYRDAAFEKVFGLVRLGRDDEARNLAHNWLSQFSDHPDAVQLRALTSWLDLRSGDLEAAKLNISGTTAKLTSIQSSLASDFRSGKLMQDNAIKLASLTAGEVPPSAELEDILNIYRQISEMNLRLNEVDGMERSMVFSIARSDLKTFKPALTNRLEEYDKLTDDLLTYGSRLIFIERQRLANQLSDLDKQKLEASEKRRKNLFSQRSQLARFAKQWATWAEPAEELLRLAQKWERLNRMAAQTQADQVNQLNSRPGPEKIGPEKIGPEKIGPEKIGPEKIGPEKIGPEKIGPEKIGSKKVDTQHFESNIQSLRQDMLTTLVDIKRRQASNLVKQSKMDDSLYIFEQYATALVEESKIISTYEPNPGKLLDTLDDEDSRSAWLIWQDVAGALHQNIKDLRQQAGDDLAKAFSKIDKLESTRSSIVHEISTLKDVLAIYGGESLGSILAYYNNALNQRLAHQYKWAGDLEYLSYTKIKNEQEATARKRDLEFQIISDNLRDIDQGSATQWPR